MNTDVIQRLLTNSGFRVLGVNGDAINIEDPSCILRSFETFTEYAWLIISLLTALMLTGWAISMIRGAKNDIFTNLRNLILIFGILGAAGPIVNAIWGDDLFARGCRQITVSATEIAKILDARDAQMSQPGDGIYEELYIEDSGARIATTPMTPQPYSAQPLSAAGTPTPVSVTVSNAAEPTKALNGTMHATGMSVSGNSVIYTTSNGIHYKRTGGSSAWRNQNPGNIRYTDFARRMGAIGRAGGFAVFPDEETGMRAIGALLRTKSYNKLTLAGAISRYAPPIENDTAAYHRKMEKLTGLSINRRMADLNDEELSRVARAIKQIEGWTIGRTEILKRGNE